MSTYARITVVIEDSARTVRKAEVRLFDNDQTGIVTVRDKERNVLHEAEVDNIEHAIAIAAQVAYKEAIKES